MSNIDLTTCGKLQGLPKTTNYKKSNCDNRNEIPTRNSFPSSLFLVYFSWIRSLYLFFFQRYIHCMVIFSFEESFSVFTRSSLLCAKNGSILRRMIFKLNKNKKKTGDSGSSIRCIPSSAFMLYFFIRRLCFLAKVGSLNNLSYLLKANVF